MKIFLKYFIYSFLVCVVLYIVFSLKIMEFKTGIVLFQVISFFAFILSVFNAGKLPKKALFFYVFIYQLLLSFLLHYIFLMDSGDLFGYIAVDSKFYSQYALMLSNKDFIEALNTLANDELSLSDYGFPLFLRWIYMLGRDVYSSMIILIIVNCFLQTVVSILLYSIGRKIFKDESKVIMTVVLWSFNSATIFLNVSGLKEPVLLCLCIGSMYVIYKIVETKNILWHIILLILIVFIWFFRYYMSLFFIIIYVGYVLLPLIYRRFFLAVCVVSVVTCMSFVGFLTIYMPEIYYAQLSTEQIYEQKGILFQLNAYILAFLSPIPKFFQLNTPQNLITVVYSIEKFFLSIWGIVAAYHAIKYHEIKYYPLISIVLFTVLMLIVSNRTIDYRYSYVIMPCYFLLIVAGVDSVKPWIYKAYFCYSILVVILFNLQLY